jgi:alpha-beta hydrolase superfamily lysophospholipase
MTRELTTPDGATLLVREWAPSGTAWVHVLLVHGLAEHSGRYQRTGRLLAEAGVGVTAFDLRGHGGSSGNRGDVERWTDFTADAGWMLEAVRAADGSAPAVLMGHSLGGLIALDAVLSGAAAPELLVLSAPCVGDSLPRWQHLVAPWIARVRPTLMLANAWDVALLSRDPEVVAAAAADPWYLPASSARMGDHGFAAQRRVKAGLATLRVPALVTHGGDDCLVPPASTEPLAEVPGVTRKVYPGLRHETLNEPEGPEVVADIVAWLREAVALPA